ncbi:hypothetical protein BLEM_0590 [Bifidobacterium lemurum]|uniref:Uncharacterized protein n=1 Tax=Bifidobacterium lemurum TaxID=1603886 RepID=A0A261FUS0_9BIFI|nr:hypothetical protein [Bifidobacterium lemurum]OZG62673.1 hypothetical protein BLEM_0590 [Bifidobacterium lemurum]QOL34608.1 hypothetical protein BL8807_01345 [Bifidobacterium lemurum]
MNEVMDWIGLAASVVTCISFAAAVASWNLNRSRVMDGLLNVGKVCDVDGTSMVRFQNVGGCGLLIQFVFIKPPASAKMIPTGSETPSNVLMPGESFNLYLTGAEDVVVSYTTHNNVNVRHIERFRIDALGVVANRIRTYVKPDRKTRKRMQYKSGELFGKFTDIAPQRRTVKTTNRPKDGDGMDNAERWLSKNGYRAIRNGIC